MLLMRGAQFRARVTVGVSVGFWLAELAATVAYITGAFGFAVAGGIVAALAIAWALVERAFARRASGPEGAGGPPSIRPEVPRSLIGEVIADLQLRGMLPAAVIAYAAFGRGSLTVIVLSWLVAAIVTVVKQIFARLPPDDVDLYRAMLEANQSGVDRDGGPGAVG